MLEPQKKLLTIDEACTVLSLSRAKIYSLIAQGVLGSITIGRSRRVPSQEIDAFIHARREEAAAADAASH